MIRFNIKIKKKDVLEVKTSNLLGSAFNGINAFKLMYPSRILNDTSYKEIKIMKQAVAPSSIKMKIEDFQNTHNTKLYWLGNGGTMINSHGTIIMIDPLLEEHYMKPLVDLPIVPNDVPMIDSILITHVDSDHYSKDTCMKLKNKCKEYHTTHYVASLLKNECDIQGIGHDIGDHIKINNIDIQLTPVDHAWQNTIEEYNYRIWDENEYCGYYINTAEAKIWHVGDSRLIEQQLLMDPPDVIFFDFSEDSWHIGLENSYKLANTYPNAVLILIHWGCIDAPDFAPFNGNPQNVIDNVVNPERVKILAPGQPYVLN